MQPTQVDNISYHILTSNFKLRTISLDLLNVFFDTFLLSFISNTADRVEPTTSCQDNSIMWAYCMDININ